MKYLPCTIWQNVAKENRREASHATRKASYTESLAWGKAWDNGSRH